MRHDVDATFICTASVHTTVISALFCYHCLIIRSPIKTGFGKFKFIRLARCKFRWRTMVNVIVSAYIMTTLQCFKWIHINA